MPAEEKTVSLEEAIQEVKAFMRLARLERNNTALHKALLVLLERVKEKT